jgi:hypothetical protein
MSWPRRGVVGLAAILGCAGQGPEGDGSSSTSSTSAGATSTGTTEGADAGSGGSTEVMTTVAASSSSTSVEGGSTSGDASSSGGELDERGCPDAAPSDWVACEGFEGITDPATELSQWNVNADGFAVEAGVGIDGGQGLRVRLQPGVMFGGWVTLRFGQGPDAPAIDSPDGRWDELWLRYRLRTGADWPGRPIGDVGELIAMNGANWGIAADLNLHGEGSMRIAARGWSCIFEGELACDGSNDWTGVLQNITNAEGSTVVFDAGHADTWQCIEAHMRLNTPGQADGEAHVWIDGAAEIEQVGIDWRGTWDDFGINAVRFTNYAEPVAAPLDFVIDDVVVGTARVGCE